jgi:putative endonuclease
LAVPFVYILRSIRNGRYYIGRTDDLRRRLREHNAGRSRSTKAFQPWELAYSESYDTLSQARKRERYLKAQKSRAFLKELMGD